MTMRKTGFFLALLAATLTACGGGDAADDAFQPPPAAPPVVTQVASLSMTTSSPTIPSDGSAPADIKVFAKNANNQFVSGVPITISASSGGLSVTTGTTDASGQAAATLSPAGDPTSRTITVTATAGTVSATVTVQVVGSSLSIQGPAALPLTQKASYTVTLNDAGGNAIAQKTLTVASARSNTLSATSLTTNASGLATFDLTAINGGNDTLTVTGSGVTATKAIAVNTDAFTFTAPAVGTEVSLGATQTVTVNWKVAGVAQVGQTVNFSTTRGTATPTSVVTDAAGNATTTVQATNAGGAVITATAGASTAQLAIEFVATTPAAIDVQPSSFSIGTGQTSTVTATVRDASGNLVKNSDVDFTLQDVTGGTLSVGTARTDSQGRAQTVYTASNSTSANQGVQITAKVHSNTAIFKTVALTVAQRQVFISLGTGNTISEPNEATYQIQFAVQLTDANGAGVANVPLSMRILSVRYYKGRRALAVSPATGWTTTYTVSAGNDPLVPTACLEEDVNRNGQLDVGEDLNSSTRIEAGNIALVSPASATTDNTGLALVNVTYPQEYAYYVDVQLSANATVQGTEYVRTSSFALPGSSTDFNSTTVAPPGPVSPFGTGTSCANTL